MNNNDIDDLFENEIFKDHLDNRIEKWLKPFDIRITALEKEFNLWKTEEYTEKENAKEIVGLREKMVKFAKGYKGVLQEQKDSINNQERLEKALRKLFTWKVEKGDHAIEAINSKTIEDVVEFIKLDIKFYATLLETLEGRKKT